MFTFLISQGKQIRIYLSEFIWSKLGFSQTLFVFKLMTDVVLILLVSFFLRFRIDQPVYINIIRDPINRFLSNYFFRRFGDWRGEQNHLIRTPQMKDDERYLVSRLTLLKSLFLLCFEFPLYHFLTFECPFKFRHVFLCYVEIHYKTGNAFIIFHLSLFVQCVRFMDINPICISVLECIFPVSLCILGCRLFRDANVSSVCTDPNINICLQMLTVSWRCNCRASFSALHNLQEIHQAFFTLCPVVLC